MAYINFLGKRDKVEILKERFVSNLSGVDLSSRSILMQGDNINGLRLLLNNGYKGKVDLVYIDPPFNTGRIFGGVGSDFAYDDRWSSLDLYLSFMWERLVLLHSLLSDRGSIYVHIDIKVGHYIKVMLDEIFGVGNFKNDITRVKCNPKNFGRCAYGNEKDVILFYSKDRGKNIWNNITIPLNDLDIKKRYPKEDSKGRYQTISLYAPGSVKGGVTGGEWRGMKPPIGRHWRTDPKKFDRLDDEGMIEWSCNGNPRMKSYYSEGSSKKIQDVWVYKDLGKVRYPTQKNLQMLELIVEQSSYEDSIVLDCFVGSGVILDVCERLGRRWVGIDQSELSISVIKEHLGCAVYDFIDLR